MSHAEDRLEKALHDPSSIYSSPNDVVGDGSLSLAARRQVLERWREDAVALQRASNEAMQGGEQDRLPEIEAALKAVGEINLADRSELA